MPGNHDEPPVRRSGAVLPPSLGPEGAPSFVVPRMEPPPPSLEAMVQSGAGRREAVLSPRLIAVALVVLALAVMGYLLR